MTMRRISAAGVAIVVIGAVAFILSFPGPGTAQMRSLGTVYHYQQGRWTGLNNAVPSTIIFRAGRGRLSALQMGNIVLLCSDTVSPDQYEWPITLSLNEIGDELVPVSGSGRFDHVFPVARGAYQGMSIRITGRLSGKRGRGYVSIDDYQDTYLCSGTTEFRSLRYAPRRP